MNQEKLDKEQKLLRDLTKALDVRCDNHYYHEPDGHCSCEYRSEKIIKICAALINVQGE